MQDYYLKFADEAEARAVLYRMKEPSISPWPVEAAEAAAEESGRQAIVAKTEPYEVANFANIDHIGTFDGIPRLEGAFNDPTALQIAHLDPVEGLALAGLNELVLDDGIGVAIHHDLQPAFEFIGTIACHVILPLVRVN